METFSESDIDGLLNLSREAGWDHTREDWQTLLATGSLWGHRSPGGEVISSVGRFDFSGLSSIGMLLVTEPERRNGRASELMKFAMETREDAQCPVMLFAGAKLEPFYQRFGFETVETVFKMKASQPPHIEVIPQEHQMETRDIEDADWPTILQMDRQVFGADRTRVLQARQKHSERSVILRNTRGTALGYGWAGRQGEQLLVGPVIGFNRFAALKIAQALMADHSGPVRLDVFGRDRLWKESLEAAGMEVHETQPLMTLEGQPLIGRRDHLYAPASQAWG